MDRRPYSDLNEAERQARRNNFNNLSPEQQLEIRDSIFGAGRFTIFGFRPEVPNEQELLTATFTEPLINPDSEVDRDEQHALYDEVSSDSETESEYSSGSDSGSDSDSDSDEDYEYNPQHEDHEDILSNIR
jgi:hypothetical protein